MDGRATQRRRIESTARVRTAWRERWRTLELDRYVQVRSQVRGWNFVSSETGCADRARRARCANV
eukprot:7377665-Pyramimonas_sp.AAC.1